MPNHDIETLQKAVETRAQLCSIFDRVELGNHRYIRGRNPSLPPSKLTSDGLTREEGFEKLLPGDLQADLDLMGKNLRESAHADTLPYLFQKYGWRIADPNDPKEKCPDAAFCDTFRADRALEKPGPDDGGYLLVKGDLTGIQDYIYNGIQPKQASGLGNLSKRLRARSILVSLLTDFIANVILRELELESWHLLFAGGGHFNLLLPSDEKTRIRLKVLNEDLSRAMRQRFGQHLELIIASIECKADIRENASPYFEQVNAKRDKMKHRQHLSDLKSLFAEEIKQDKQAKEEREKRENRIGGAFPKQHFLLEIMSKKELVRHEREHGGDLVLAEFSGLYYHTLLAVKSLNDKKDDYSAHKFLTKNKGGDIQHADILALNNTDFLPKESWKEEGDFNFPVSFGFRFLGKNAPRLLKENSKEEDESRDIMDFEAIAKIDQEDQKKGEGFLRLGAMMLDVDNLGLIFSHGLNDATLARIITLSRELNYFFTAHFNQRAKEHRVYVVYSGGDDAFAVGKWDKLIRFAKVLREDFQCFIRYEDNQNKDVHFSAGLFMSNPFYPIGRFYRDTKALQEKAKGGNKNQVDVFDHTLDWGSFTDKVDLGDMFRDVLKRGQTESGRKFSASFAYRIMQLVKTSYYERDEWRNEKFYKQGGLRMEKFARNVANMRYLFARNSFSGADIQKVTSDLEVRLTDSFLKKAFNFDTEFNARDYLVALNFAMLQIRSKTKPPEHG